MTRRQVMWDIQSYWPWIYQHLRLKDGSFPWQCMPPGTSYPAWPWCFLMPPSIVARYPAAEKIPPNYLTDHEKILSFSLSENGCFIFPRLDPTMENVPDQTGWFVDPLGKAAIISVAWGSGQRMTNWNKFIARYFKCTKKYVYQYYLLYFTLICICGISRPS